MYPDQVIKQYVFEAEGWARFLAYLRQEVISYKTRLAEIVTSGSDNELLEAAENFQETFLSQDRIVSFLSDELKKQNQLLQADIRQSEEVFNQLVKGQKTLRKDMRIEEQLFARVKEEFADYAGVYF